MVQLKCCCYGENPIYHTKTKHIRVRYHLIQVSLLIGIRLEEVVYGKNVVDALTITLPHYAFEHCCHLMGVPYTIIPSESSFLAFNGRLLHM